jgi:ABC-type transport system involved in multi-copper enzyme maturation permease subunit
MTAPELAAPPAIPPATAPSRLIRARDAIAFEWTKLRSLRSTSITLLFAVIATLGLTAIVARGLAAGPGLPASGPINALTGSFLSYAEYGTLPLAILGALTFSSEYSTGLIRLTFTAVPRRLTVLGAKAAVAGGSALVIGELLAFACFGLAQAILSGHGGVSLTDPGVLGSVLAAGCLLPACVLVGVALGAVLRHTAGAIASTVAAVYLLAVLSLALPHPWNLRIGQFTLPFAAYQLITSHPSPDLLSPGLSLLVLAAWPAVTLLAAAVLLSRRDL